MNRIRIKNNTYQVLHTPNLIIAPSMELLTGNWDDEDLKGFYVEEYDNLSEAQCSAFKMPDIDWYKLVRLNVDEYHKNNKYINHRLKQFNMFSNIESHLMSPDELKETTFNRVLKFGERYSTTYNMNDIITYSIIDPWTSNLNKISYMLEQDDNLKIFNKKVYWNKITILTGRTDLGLTYEIKLFPTILWKWAKWTHWYARTNKNENQIAIDTQRKKSIALQNTIDKTMNVR
jgi:hypothetical protein